MPGEDWLPGSFTKNYSWGVGQGLKRLHEAIKLGFDDQLIPVRRDDFRSRVNETHGPDFIPLNFFLFNYIENGSSLIAVDELVFQAITADHSERFDKLALFAFNFGFAGVWKGMRRGQRYPTPWAKGYILDQIAKGNRWANADISADEIERYLQDSPNFKAETFRKVSTNLAYLYKIGGLAEFASRRVERWWVDSLFLALDRITGDRRIDGELTQPSKLLNLLMESRFLELSGPVTSEKSFATAHLLSLYGICGSLDRFKPDAVRDLVEIEIPDYHWQSPNDQRPQAAVHPTNPRIFKTIPRECAKLAEKVGFKIIYADDVPTFDPVDFTKRQVADAVDSLRRDGATPTMSADELHKLTRGE